MGTPVWITPSQFSLLNILEINRRPTLQLQIQKYRGVGVTSRLLADAPVKQKFLFPRRLLESRQDEDS